ncbi:DUF6883 domain-containing protein [Thauera phenylacetica]|uniref:DUF6883 domain-containing protein n=1 Tax=Thauera phenylacetica TaxID=164400 RepID=UPI0039E4E922
MTKAPATQWSSVPWRARWAWSSPLPACCAGWRRDRGAQAAGRGVRSGRIQEGGRLSAGAHPPRWGAKARFFLARGARADAWEAFARVLVEHARLNPVAGVRDDPAGRARLFQIDCHVTMPDDSRPCIRTIWELRAGARCPRLVTAYPAG